MTPDSPPAPPPPPRPYGNGFGYWFFMLKVHAGDPDALKIWHAHVAAGYRWSSSAILVCYTHLLY